MHTNTYQAESWLDSTCKQNEPGKCVMLRMRHVFHALASVPMCIASPFCPRATMCVCVCFKQFCFVRVILFPALCCVSYLLSEPPETAKNVLRKLPSCPIRRIPRPALMLWEVDPCATNHRLVLQLGVSRNRRTPKKACFLLGSL